jgi:hypothetical protein
MRFICAVIMTSICLTACGKSDTTPANSDSSSDAAKPTQSEANYGDVAFTTYQSDGFRIVFLNPSKARKTWANMDGDAVSGQYTQRGNEIEVQWDPAASHHGSLSERFSQTGPCALARYERVDRNNKLHDEEPQIYQRTKPRCDAVRLVQ